MHSKKKMRAQFNQEKACREVPDSGPVRPCCVVGRGPTMDRKGLRGDEGLKTNFFIYG